ncbi:DUF2800 domain-containing protein [Thiolapillus sp.]|uniref:DUF2800 domain-containing protein n=1 Tax=Thiolapillus sp. TaxID=2017437 RepID=UPI003AF68F26
MSHSEISPSNAHRWMRCPGSVKLLRKVPPETESSEDASLGTRKHALMAQFAMLFQSSLSIGLHPTDVVAADFLKSHPLATDEMRDGIFDNQLVEYAEYLMHNPNDGKEPARVDIESFLDLSAVSPGMRGTADAIIYRHSDTTIEVVDYKSGSIPVTPHANEQLMLYLIGALQMTSDGLCSRNGRHLITIAQPSVETGPLSFRSVTVSIDTLRSFMFNAKTKAAAALNFKNPLRQPSNEACRWCRAKAICREYHEWAGADVLIDACDKEGCFKISYQLAKRVLDNRKWITALIKSCQDYAIGKLNGGENFPGYCLVEKPGRRSVIKSDEVKEYLEALFGLDALQPVGVGTLDRLGRENDVSIDFAITRGEPKMTLAPIEDVSDDFKTEEGNENE